MSTRLQLGKLVISYQSNVFGRVELEYGTIGIIFLKNAKMQHFCEVIPMNNLDHRIDPTREIRWGMKIYSSGDRSYIFLSLKT